MGTRRRSNESTSSEKCSTSVAFHWSILPSMGDRNDYSILPYMSLLSTTNGNNDPWMAGISLDKIWL